MQSSLKPLAVGACVAALAASFLAGPAAASTVSPALPTLVLSLKDEHTLLVPDTRTLGCDDPENVTGSHPRRERACATLDAAGGNFENLQTTGGACPMIYDPVTATAKGRYKGMRIDFEAVYANQCVAAAESADIFRW
ncbi:hypothetical protein JOF56_011196 [Kibdelosporangium banguiense]|uniref:Subtilisin inhibitor domain-containing protein n=1 Tax=Kibdelosporangium banguiense TaxID=1365924 RepID=A0ABS4U2G3_9PSEU|nr:SSI family serine proteinase inhibitor [Kibdelosporangium banguiense]MBP2330811.1 hypothetical protein [Kibdelosporangium banguiense]